MSNKEIIEHIDAIFAKLQQIDKRLAIMQGDITDVQSNTKRKVQGKEDASKYNS
jgi:hypothetical protein